MTFIKVLGKTDVSKILSLVMFMTFHIQLDKVYTIYTKFDDVKNCSSRSFCCVVDTGCTQQQSDCYSPIHEQMTLMSRFLMTRT